MDSTQPPLRVLELLVSTTLGGGPKHVYDLVRRLPPDEFCVAVAAPADGPFFERFERLGIRVVELPLNRLRWRTLPAVVRLAREWDADVIHSHGKGPGLYGRLAARWTGARSVHTFHGIHSAKYPLALRRLYLWLEALLLRWTHTVVHVSESQRLVAQALGLAPAGKSEVVLNAVDPKEASQPARPGLREELGIPGGLRLIGTVARFDEVKALEILIEAFRLLAARHAALALVLVGGGPKEKALRRLVEKAGLPDRVHFLGPRQDAVELLHLLDVYVSASRSEGLPLSLLEAMAAGLPVVVSRVTGHIDAVVEGVTGILVQPERPDELAAAVARLLEDPELRLGMGRAGRERVEMHFRIDAMVRGLARIYRQAAATRSPFLGSSG